MNDTRAISVTHRISIFKIQEENLYSVGCIVLLIDYYRRFNSLASALLSPSLISTLCCYFDGLQHRERAIEEKVDGRKIPFSFTTISLLLRRSY